MPIVHIEILEGRPASKKRALIEQVTQAVVNSLEVRPQQVRVSLRPVETKRRTAHVACGRGAARCPPAR